MSDTPNTDAPSAETQVDQAVAQGGAYDVLRRRLDEHRLLEPVPGEMRTGAFRPAQVYRKR